MNKDSDYFHAELSKAKYELATHEESENQYKLVKRSFVKALRIAVEHGIRRAEAALSHGN